VPTAALEPTSRSTVPARLIRSPQRQPARLESPQATSLRPISSSPTWLGLDHASSVVSGVPRGKLSPFLPAPPTISRAQSPGYSKCPASELITFWAATRRQHLLRTPPGSPWQGHGIGHALEPSQRPPAQLTPRAADSRRSAPLAADATVSSATVDTSVAHPAPSSTGQVPRASTHGPGSPSHPSAHSVSSKASVAPGFDRTAPHHFVSGHLVLAHLARTRPCVFGPPWLAPVPVVTTHIRAAVLQPCQSTGVLEMPSFSVHRLLGTPPSSAFPANATGADVACPRLRPHAGAIAASARAANPACSGLRFATLARR